MKNYYLKKKGENNYPYLVSYINSSTEFGANISRARLHTRKEIIIAQAESRLNELDIYEVDMVGTRVQLNISFDPVDEVTIEDKIPNTIIGTRPVMDIYSEAGSRVVFAFPNNGYANDQKRMKEQFSLGCVLTIEDIEIEDSTSYVTFEGYDGSYNTVFFANVDNILEDL